MVRMSKISWPLNVHNKIHLKQILVNSICSSFYCGGTTPKLSGLKQKSIFISHSSVDFLNIWVFLAWVSLMQLLHSDGD